MPPGDDKDTCWYVVRAFLRFQLRFGACSFWPIAGHCKSKDSCAAALKQQNAVTIDLKLWHEIQREILERPCPNCWIPVEQKHIDACFCDGHTAASLWSWTSASSESQVSLHCGLELLRGANSSPWLPNRGAPSRIKIALEQQLYFWVAGFIQYICFDKRSCWKQRGAEDLVVGTTFAYCVWLRSQAGHTVSFLRVVAVCTLRVALTSPQVTTWNQPEYNMRLKFCKNLGVAALANVQIVLTCLFKDWHLSTINPNFAGASLPCASWWWQGQLLICSQGIFEIPVEIWSVFILTNCWALQKQGTCAAALKQQNAVTIDLKLWHEIQREISERACPNCWIPVEQKHIDACFCDGHTAASLWSWTSASSESQVSLHCGLELLRGANSSPWLPNRGAPSRIKIALEQKLYFWVAGFIQYICFDKRSCWKQRGAEDLVVGTTFAYCVWLRSQAGHTVSFLRVVAVCTLRVALTLPQVTTWNQPEYNMRLKFCKNLGVAALANVQIVLTRLFKDWHLSTINPNFAGASLPCASWWWQGQLLICSQGIFEIPVEIWSVFILTNCWALQKQGFLCCGTEAAECSDHRFKALAWNTERDLREGMSKLLDPSWTKTYRRMFLWRAHSSVSVVLNFRFERIPGQSPLWSRTSAWSEFQSLVAQPWSAKLHQDRFRAATLFLGCWFYSIYMFWQEVLLKTTWGGGLSCWNNFCILCMVEIPSWTYSKFFESCCCLYFTSRFDFAPGHDLESARVQHEAQILQELGSSGISKCPDCPDLLV